MQWSDHEPFAHRLMHSVSLSAACVSLASLSAALPVARAPANTDTSLQGPQCFAGNVLLCWMALERIGFASKAGFPFNPKGRFKLSLNTLTAVFALSAEILEFSPTFKEKN